MISQVLENKTSEAQHWTAFPERGTPASLRLLAWIATHIGRLSAKLLLYPITLYFVITARSARRTSYEYLKRVHGNRLNGGMSFVTFIASPRQFWIAFICCVASSSALT